MIALALSLGFILGAALMLAVRTHWLEGTSVVDAAPVPLPDNDAQTMALVIGLDFAEAAVLQFPTQRGPVD